jgi:hypothetical protein
MGIDYDDGQHPRNSDREPRVSFRTTERGLLSDIRRVVPRTLPCGAMKENKLGLGRRSFA